MSKRSRKIKILKTLSKHLQYYRPDLKHHFICPTCLQKIPISKPDLITEAHIIPRVADGKLTTLLCHKCNSRFGTKQDKWFGELLNILRNDNPSIMKTSQKDKYFVIDGIKVNGCWDIDKNGNLTFTIYKDRNPPEVNKLIDNKLRVPPSKINLSFSLPLIRKKSMIDVGFLTAGYLMWFRYLGYSWVLQNYLDQIREQILNPEKEILKENYIATCDELNCKPWIGFMPIEDDIVLTFGIGPHIVIFPPRDRPDIYSKIGTFTLNLNVTDIRAVQLPKKLHHDKPTILMFEKRILVLPDMVHNLTNSIILIQFTRHSNEANIFTPISEQEYNKLKNQPTVLKVHAKLEK